eukprot:7752680-Lingulodinium_polyedra.AAC.1
MFTEGGVASVDIKDRAVVFGRALVQPVRFITLGGRKSAPAAAVRPRLTRSPFGVGSRPVR